MKKEKIEQYLKNFNGTNEFKAIKAIFEKKKERLKDKAIKEEDDISKVIGCNHAIKQLDRILKQIKNYKKEKTEAHKDKYAS